MSESRRGTINVLNIKTGETVRIPTELYQLRKDIYFGPNSKVFKEWKSKQEKMNDLETTAIHQDNMK